jgi:hypothetical protein
MNCMNHHHLCQIPLDEHVYMPTRVLDLGVVDDGDLDLHLRAPLRLVESADVIGDRTYACLSHRWESSRHTITTQRATYEKRRNRIPFQDLDLAYQDTVHIMRRLRKQYLWIDSLCILQDDPEDWEAESRSMAQVYNKALFTIARQCDFKTSLRCIPHKEHIVSDPHISPPVYARAMVQHIWHVPFPLDTRGWIYQERLLSPRVIHFSHAEISWECYEDSNCQCGATPSALARGTHLSTPKMHHAKALGLKDDTSKTNVSVMGRRWREIVSEYSGLDFTQSSDRLHAIQGCAEQMREYLKDTYHFGLWRAELVKRHGVAKA